MSGRWGSAPRPAGAEKVKGRRGSRADPSDVASRKILVTSSGLPSNTTATPVQWEYRFASYPTGLGAYLCNIQRCVGLSGASGTTSAFAADVANNSWQFDFQVTTAETTTYNPPIASLQHHVYMFYQY
jgi:flagellar protein FlhE